MNNDFISFVLKALLLLSIIVHLRSVGKSQSAKCEEEKAHYGKNNLLSIIFVILVLFINILMDKTGDT